MFIVSSSEPEVWARGIGVDPYFQHDFVEKGAVGEIVDPDVPKVRLDCGLKCSLLLISVGCG